MTPESDSAQTVLEREFTRKLGFLRDSSLALLSIPAEGPALADFIGERLSELAPDCLVILNESSSDGKQLSTIGVWGLGKSLLDRAIGLCGFNPVGKTFPLVPPFDEYLLQDRLVKVDGGFAAFAGSAVPHHVAQALASLLHFHDSYTMGLLRDTKLVGAVHILARTKTFNPDYELIETFIHQASIALHRRSVELELVQARIRAESSSTSKSRFLANMSHEIRTPMNGVIGMAELLMNTPLSDEQRDYVGTLRSSGMSLLGILNDILDFSKIESGLMSLEIQPFNMFSLIEDIGNLIRSRAQHKALRFSTRVGDDLPVPLLGDPLRIRQIILNLLGNAVKFTSEGGIDLIVRRAATDTADDHAVVSVEIVVTDTGPGISSDKQEEIFGRFIQQDESTTRLFGGTGLGLAISRQLVELMGGRISLISTVGIGSSFTCSLPLRIPDSEPKPLDLPDAASLTTAASRVIDKTENPVVLVAEDNEINRMVVVRMLKLWGCQPLEAVNGEEAVAFVRSHAIDLILMDVQMPVMDGLEATRCIRAIQTKHIPIIALTAHALADDRQKCRDAGMDSHVCKPFEPEALKKIITECIASDLELPLFSAEALMERTGHDKELVKHVIESFGQSMPLRIERITKYAHSNEYIKLAEEVHTLKGTSMTLGADRLADLAKSIHLAASERDSSRCRELSLQLPGLFKETILAQETFADGL